MSRFTRSSRRRQVTRQYGSETLEVRRVLTAFTPPIGEVTDVQGPTNTMVGDTLFIRGSMGSDNIRVIDNGGGSVTVVNSAVQNGRPETFTAVQHVVLRSKKGSDTVNYVISDSGRSVRDVVICLGPDGQNSFTLLANGASQVLPDSDIHFTVNGGGENDNIKLDLNGAQPDWVIRSQLRAGDDVFVLNADPPPESEIIPCIRVHVDGSSGNDRISINLAGGAIVDQILVDAGAGNDFVAVTADPPPELGFIRIDGGAGNDTIDALFSMNPQNQGRLAVDLLGGDGDDNLSLQADGLGASAFSRALLDGGAGFDTAVAPMFAKLVNNEA